MNSKRRFAVIDLETEMLNDLPEYGDKLPRIIQIGITIVDCNRKDGRLCYHIKDSKKWDIDPGRPIKPRPAEFEIDRSVPRYPLEAVANEIEHFVKDDGEYPKIAAWPITFDSIVLINEYERIGRKYPFDRRALDVGTLFKLLFDTSWKISSAEACRRLFNDVDDTLIHDALYDSQNIARLLCECLNNMTCVPYVDKTKEMSDDNSEMQQVQASNSSD